MFDNAEAALAAGQPPDFLFGTVSERWIAPWAVDEAIARIKQIRAE